MSMLDELLAYHISYSSSKDICYSYFSSSYDGHEDQNALELHDEVGLDGYQASVKVNGVDGVKIVSMHIPTWLSQATPDEFLV